MDSAHAEAACLLIEAGADRTKVGFSVTYFYLILMYVLSISISRYPFQENLDNEMPEDVLGVGGQEQVRAKQYVIERCGKRS